MKANTFGAIAIFIVATVCGGWKISAQSPPCRARTLDLRAIDIGNNFWMVGTTPYDPQTDPTSPHWDYFNYFASVPAVSQQSIPWYLTCSGGDIAKRGNASPQAIQANSDSCKNALNSAIFAERNFGSLDPAFDTMEWYIRHCYKNAQATYAWNGLEGAWGDTIQYPGMRDSVFNFVLFGLGLRSDDEWFCLGVPLLQIKYVQSNGNIMYPQCRAIDRFLMDNPRCAWNYDADSNDYANLLFDQWHVWSDSARGYGVKFDSTIPTLHQIGLDTLLKFAASSSVHYDLQTSQILLDVRLTDNPVTARTSVIVDVGREAYIHFEVYDILGHKLDGAGYEGVFEQGARTVPLDLRELPSGSYYLRISTANNEVRTIKMVKE